MDKILEMLEKDCRLTPKQIAVMLGMDIKEVKEKIEEYEKENIILGYKALIDWDRVNNDTAVTALIEVKITPQRGEGFDRIAKRIYQYDEVESVYLMSGGYDLTVIIAGRTLKEVAQFVAAKLAPIEGVVSTATHFILKKYKDRNCIFDAKDEQEEGLLFT